VRRSSLRARHSGKGQSPLSLPLRQLL